MTEPCRLAGDWRGWDAQKRADRLYMACPACGQQGSHVGQAPKPRTPQIPGPGTTPLGLPVAEVRDIGGRREFVARVDGDGQMTAHPIRHGQDCEGGQDCGCPADDGPGYLVL